ncbi:MAG: hypothetical protein H0T56_17755, partial [Pseudaminobacter sp.]|nr:hypothetical protein [Pseudaminobacter sp.]
VCDPVIKSPSDDLAHDFGEFDVKDVKLFLTTYQNPQPGSNPGVVCPPLKVTSRAQANQAGPVSMRIWRQKNGGPITSQFQQAWASFDAAKNGYFVTYETWEDVGTTSHFQFKTEIVENDPFAPFDGWKDITVHCTSPGGGGLAPLPPIDPDQPKPQASWQGEVIVAGSAGRDKSCPRKGQVFFEATRGGPGDFDYRISCSNGAYFEGTATGFNQGGPNFEAYGAHDLSINKTRSIQCTLQEILPNGSPVTVAVGKEDFTCNNPAIDPDVDDVTSEPRPNPAKPVFPAVVVTPQPKCDRDERLIRGKCVNRLDLSIFCKQGFKQVGKTCMRNPVVAVACKRDEIRVGVKCVKKPGVSIHCLPGYKQVGQKCVKKPQIAQTCKRNEQRINGKCVMKPTVSILCKKGFKLAGQKCVRVPTLTQTCRRGEKLVRGNCVGKPDRAPIKTFFAPKPKREKALTFKTSKPSRARKLLRRQN